MHHDILVVDDDVHVRRLCRLTLERPGYVLTEAGTGKEALLAIKTTVFDLILLDLSMPEVDGFEFLKAVRFNSPQLTILVMSGLLSGTMLTAAKLFGAAATLAKPFSSDSLLAAVGMVLAPKALHKWSDWIRQRPNVQR